MPRSWFAVVLTVLVLLTSVGGTVASASSFADGKPITLTGKLEHVNAYGIPHYEINGYVLVYSVTSRLDRLKDTEVTVEGTELTGPTLFMRKVIEVIRVVTRDPDSGPADARQSVTTPVAPDPTLTIPPKEGGQISVPAPPIPFFGSPYYLLIGRLEFIDGEYYILEQRATGVTQSWVVSATVDLGNLKGRQVGFVAAQELLSGGRVRYQIRHALVLSEDLLDRISDRAGIIYVAPRGQVTVKLRGSIIRLDHAPVIGNGRTLIGLRSIAENLRARVDWNGATQTATVYLGQRAVVVQVGSNRVILRQAGEQDVTVLNDVAPVIVGGRVLVPARVLSEGLGLKVTWSDTSQTVELN